MEWNLYYYFAQPSFDLKLNVAAARDPKLMYFGHKLLIEVYTDKDLCILIKDLTHNSIWDNILV